MTPSLRAVRFLFRRGETALLGAGPVADDASAGMIVCKVECV